MKTKLVFKGVMGHEVIAKGSNMLQKTSLKFSDIEARSDEFFEVVVWGSEGFKFDGYDVGTLMDVDLSIKTTINKTSNRAFTYVKLNDSRVSLSNGLDGEGTVEVRLLPGQIVQYDNEGNAYVVMKEKLVEPSGEIPYARDVETSGGIEFIAGSELEPAEDSIRPVDDLGVNGIEDYISRTGKGAIVDDDDLPF